MSYRTALLTTALCLASTATLAYSPPAPGTGSALRSACPQLDQALQELLQGPAWRLQEDTRMQVQFRLEGERISAVRSQGGARHLHARVRRAVEQLSCRSDQAAPQELAFSLALQRR